MNNNEIKINKGIQDLHKIVLRSEEKSAMLAKLVSCASVQPSPYLKYIRRRFVYVTVSLALVLVLAGGSVTLASSASASLPGDLLYPVKIHINEPIQGLLKGKGVEKTAWEKDKAILRLEEAEDLAEKGELTEKKREKIEKEFEKHADAVEESGHDKDFDDRVNDQLERVRGKSRNSSVEQDREVKNLEKGVKDKMGKNRGGI